MNTRQARWLVVVVSSGLLVWLLVRRRAALLPQLPDLVDEHIVLPMSDLMRDSPVGGRTSGDGAPERMTRKVGRNRKISVGGKLYGPLEPELIGQQVEVAERGGRLVVYWGTDEVGSFERQDQNS